MTSKNDEPRGCPDTVTGPCLAVCARCGRDMDLPDDFTDWLARALHDADCGCGVYDDEEDPRYIEAARAALEQVES